MTTKRPPAQLSEPTRVLWVDLFALLGACLAWMGAELASYATQHLMCRAGASTEALHLVLVGISAVAAVVAAAAGVTAWRLRQHAEDPELSGRTGGDRRHLFAGAGILLSFIFLVAIVMTGLVGLFAETC